MSETTVATNNQTIIFKNKFREEFFRKSRFARYTGTNENNIIVFEKGDKIINIPLITRLKQSGVSGNQVLDGNEENLANYSFRIQAQPFRHAVRMTKNDARKTDINLMEAARSQLLNWGKNLQKMHTIQAMGAVIGSGDAYYNYGGIVGDNFVTASTGAINDTWNTNNQDRILYGALKSNLVAGNHTSSLGNIDTTADKMSASIARLAKEMAEMADPHITPVRTEDDEEFYVMFHDPYAFRDLSLDPEITQAQRELLVRGTDNPIFRGGDILYGNILHVKIPEIANFIDFTSIQDPDFGGVWGANAGADSLKTSGSGSTRVGVSFLCGQQAVSYGLEEEPDFVVDREKDYKFRPGVAVEMMHMIKKSHWNSKQHGVVTVFSSAALSG